MKKKKNVVVADNHNYDNDGNILPAFPTNESTKKDKAKTSVGFTILAVILLLLAFAPILAGTIVLGIYCYKLVPYYTFWPFVGTILCGVLALAFYIGCLIVTRKNSKHSIRSQTVKMVITFVCLTSVFGALVTYVFPDVIDFATQDTLFVDDLLYLSENQADKNAKLERDFIRYNILAGNLGHELSFYDMSQCTTDSKGKITGYEVDEIDESYNRYIDMEDNASGSIAKAVKLMEKNNSLKYELYDFIYSNFVLTDAKYGFMTGDNIAQRRAITLAMVDYIYKNGSYEQQIKDGFSDPEIKRLFDINYDSFNQDGYLTFDDSPLLYAQRPGRMTIPIVLRLILNEPWKYSQPSYTDESGVTYNWVTGTNETVFYPEYYEDSNYLLEIYDPTCLEKFNAVNGVFDRESKDRKNEDGTPMMFAYYKNPSDINDKYNGWIIYEDGTVKRPQSWLVLDMLGDPMPLASIDLSSDIGEIVGLVLNMLPEVTDALGGLLGDDLTPLLNYVTDGASLSIALYLDDDGQLQITLFSANVPNAMLGYMQASWVQMDNLLFAVVTVIASRNWLVIFGAVGAVLVIAAGVLRECGKKTRERTEKSIDRILRENAAKEAGIEPGDIPPAEIIMPIE